MASISAFEAKTHFGELLDHVVQGQEIVITRYDKPVARIIPEGRCSKREVQAAIDGLMALQQQIAKRAGKRAALTDAEVRDAIAAGRA